MQLVILALLACGGDSGPNEASARASLEALRPAFDDIRKQVDAGLGAVSQYEEMDCTAMMEGMREMCQAQAAAQAEEADKQVLAFRDNVMAPISRRDDVISIGCFQGETYLGGEPEPPAGAAPETVDVDGLTLGWGTFGERAGIRISWTTDDRHCDIYLQS